MSSKETTMTLPPRWGDDSLTEFIKGAFANILATFVRKPAFRVLVAVDKNFMKIGENLANPRDILAAFLIHRSHAALRGACRMAASGQVAEAHPLLRSCIEYALYALHINSTPGLGELWLNRHENADSMKQCRKAFMHVKITETLEKRDPALYKIIEKLYEQTIDFGAHPNERAVTGSLIIDEQAGAKNFQNIYLHGDAVSLDHALKMTAQVGLGSLLMFEHIFRDRFRLLAIDVELQKLRNVL